MKSLNRVWALSGARFILMAALISAAASFAGARGLAQRAAPPVVACSAVCISITADGFMPAEVAIPVGSEAEFRSADGKSHRLALGAGTEHDQSAAESSHHADGEHEHHAGVDSGLFGPDEAWRVQFEETGTYLIHDHLNPELSVLVVVYEPGS